MYASARLQCFASWEAWKCRLLLANRCTGRRRRKVNRWCPRGSGPLAPARGGPKGATPGRDRRESAVPSGERAEAQLRCLPGLRPASYDFIIL